MRWRTTRSPPSPWRSREVPGGPLRRASAGRVAARPRARRSRPDRPHGGIATRASRGFGATGTRYDPRRPRSDHPPAAAMNEPWASPSGRCACVPAGLAIRAGFLGGSAAAGGAFEVLVHNGVDGPRCCTSALSQSHGTTCRTHRPHTVLGCGTPAGGRSARDGRRRILSPKQNCGRASSGRGCRSRRSRVLTLSSSLPTTGDTKGTQRERRTTQEPEDAARLEAAAGDPGETGAHAAAP